MKITSLLFTSVFLITSSLNAQSFEWANSMGSSEFDLGNAVTVDDLGNSYTVGQFRQTVDFDPSAGVLELTAVGLHDAYIRKSDSDGNLIWVKSLQGTNYVSGHSIVVDASGNVYVAGHFWDTADFDPGAGVYNLTSEGEEDIFILKLNSAGDFLWARSFGAVEDDVARSIAIDADGNLCITGLYLHTIDFDPGAGVAELTAFSFLYSDVFVLKLTPSGDYIWCKSMGGDNSDMAYGISTDIFNNIYVTGHYRAEADFDPGVGVFNSTAIGQYDIFIVKLDLNGDFLWMKSIGSADNDEGYAIVTEGPHAVYVTGYFSGTADFDPNAGVENLTSNGLNDIFVLKLNADGSYAWANSMGSTGNDLGLAVATDFYGDCYVTGQYYGTVDFDASVGTNELTSNGDADIFIQRLTASGGMEWTVSEGAAGNDAGKGIATFDANFVHIIGGFKNTVDFDVDAPVYDLTSFGNFDIFEQKLGVVTDGASVNEVLGQNEISIFPNPSEGELTIQLEGGMLENAQIRVLDMQGRIIVDKRINKTEFALDLSDYDNGVYLIEILSTGITLKTQRIMLSH